MSIEAGTGSHRLNVSLVAADRKVWTGTAAMVVARSTEGDVGVLPGHQPILSILLPSVVIIRGAEGGGAGGTAGAAGAASGDIEAVVSGGFLSVAGSEVAVLAESVLLPSEISVESAQALLAEAREVEHDSAADKAALDQADADIRFAEAQLRVAGGAVASGH
jgi:F-type H+-transporting ATPase subunit epsilon